VILHCRAIAKAIDRICGIAGSGGRADNRIHGRHPGRNEWLVPNRRLGDSDALANRRRTPTWLDSSCRIWIP
jgi:hypothetical protein